MTATGIIGQARKVFGLIDRRYWPWVVILMVLTFISSILEVLSITAILPLFRILLDPTRIARIDWIRRIFGEIQPTRFFLAVCIGIFALFVAKVAISLFASWLKYYIQARLYENLSSRLMNYYLESAISFHLRHSSPELLRNLNSYVSQTTQYGFLGFVNLTSDVLLSLGITVVLVWLEPTISLIAATSLVTIAGIYVALGQPYFLRLSRRYKASSAKVLQTANESLIGVKTLKTLGREAYFEDLYRRCVAEFCDVLRKNSFVGTVPRQVLELIAVTALMGLLVSAVLDGRDPTAFISILAVFAAAIYRLMPAIVRIATTLQNLRFGYEAIEVVYAGIMRVRATKPSRPHLRTKSLSGDISLRDVTFSYEEASRPALDRINLDIRNGEAVAFVGSSGAGKTTLADLILGLHKPDSGTLFINDVCYPDPSTIPRGAFGYVPQDPFLIDDTIRRNIALGIPDNAVDDEQFARAVKAAALDEFIAGLPDGLDTLVGDRGVRLSGGQRQRIGIARAMYADPDVLVLDEATSSIDMTTEADITTAINRLHGRKTLIIIAHRLSTIRECDRIFFLDQGRVVASGRYDELIRKNTEFAAMAQHMATSAELQRHPQRV
jgi:ABC-type multidrug transport system fused ATPase/permease subunit